MYIFLSGYEYFIYVYLEKLLSRNNGCGNINNKSYGTLGKHIMDSFEFESGAVLENVAVEYRVSGIPTYDEEGDITNAVVYCPTLKGGHSILIDYHEMIRENDFDKDGYFFIKIVSLGTPDSCSPSTTGLKYKFPSYTFKDRINFKRQFLKEKFNIDKIHGVIGEGLGGFEVFTWACEYPDDMEFIIVINSSFKTYGYRYIFIKSAEAILESSEDMYSDVYSPSLSKLSVAVIRLLFSGYFSKSVFENLTNDELDVLMDDYVDTGLFMDIHDFKSRNDCILEFNVEDKLPNIKTKALIMGVEGFLFFNPQRDVLPLADIIENATVRVFDPIETDYYEEKDYSSLGDEILSFLKQFKK